jgi:hypoxanthine phosphoribosyltransferase
VTVEVADPPTLAAPTGGRSRKRSAIPVEGTRFAHASEAELARILDFYLVRWEYEPRTFPIQWNLEGQVIESFSPDFYLPESDLWLELTTLRQSLVRRKNRKLRRLRELYPMIRIKLLYARDFRALMLKYGRLDVAASLIGADGQVVPDAPVTPADRSRADVARSTPATADVITIA